MGPVNFGIDFLTIGQYLQPTRKHAAIDRFVTPDEFKAYETIAKAKIRKTGDKVNVVHWVILSSEGRYIRMIGHGPREEWESILPRFQAIRDGMVILD